MAAILDEAGNAVLDEVAAFVLDEAGTVPSSVYPLQRPPHAGGLLAWTSPPATGDMAVPAVGAALLVIGDPAQTVIIQLPMLPVDGFAVTRTVTIPPAGRWLIPLPPGEYGTRAVTLSYPGAVPAAVAYLFIP